MRISWVRRVFEEWDAVRPTALSSWDGTSGLVDRLVGDGRYLVNRGAERRAEHDQQLGCGHGDVGGVVVGAARISSLAPKC